MASLIGRKLGGYLIEEEVGRGAMGVVFKARQLSMDRYVALKFLPMRLAQNERFVARFLREARTAGQLSHPNLVNVHDAGVVDGMHYIAMEYVDGASIHQVVREHGPYSEKETLDIAAQIAAALKAAHAKGILHRDVKPDNFLIDSSGRVRLADLGLAIFQYDENEGEVTQSGTTVGTPHYMSPEQCSGGTVDARSDLYSLGASMYVLATGHTPFLGASAATILVRAVTEQPRPLQQLNPKLSPAFVALVEKMMAKDPAKRFQSADETLDAIERCERGQHQALTKEQADLDSVPLVPLDEAPRYKLLLYGAAAAVVALVAVGLLVGVRGEGAPSKTVAAARNSQSPAGGPAGTPSANAKADAKDSAAPPPKAEAKDNAPGPVPKEKKGAPDLPPPPPPPPAEKPFEEFAHIATVKKLSALKLDLREKILQDPDAAIARMEEFLKQHPGPRIANIAQEFLTRAKESKERIAKDWAEAKEDAQQEALAGHKAKAFHVLRSFVDEHGGTKQASIALGMMEGWVTDLRAEASKEAQAGNYEEAIEMLTLADSKLPPEITAPLQKDLERLTPEHKKFQSLAQADRKQLAVVLEKAGAGAREASAVTGRRYDFEESARICREGLAQIKTALLRKELDGVANTYSRAAQVLKRMRLALESAKSVELPGLGHFKETGQLTGWDEQGGPTFRLKAVGGQTVPWREVTPESLLQIAQALRIASGKSSSDLLDIGALAFAAGAHGVAIEKLEAAAADPEVRALAEAPLHVLKPRPSPAEREAQARKLFEDASAAHEKKENGKALKLQMRLVGELADTDFVQKHLKEIRDLGLPRSTVAPATPAAPPGKTKTADQPKAPPPEKTKTADQPKAPPPEKAEPKDETAAKKEEKKDTNKEEKTDEAVSAELRKLGWTEVTGNWTQDPKRKTAFSVIGGGSLTAPLVDAFTQVTFQVEERGFVAIYLRYQQDTTELKDLRAVFEEYNLVLGNGYGVHYTGNTATVYGDAHPAAGGSGAKATYAKKAVPLKVQAMTIPPGPHSISVTARGDRLEINLDGRTLTTARKLRPDGGTAIIISGNAKVDSPIVRQLAP